ncbi:MULTISPECIES: DivIVA domain-containing protein [unclassified Brevibacterium]|uniref:DivIVA domain-containing protein n=1 Tax=unclassified Brevibacterium TaxID=2614124 RepID=UPI00107FF81A|nr:DivIVA domain-containing protein [Brevibacterium sp. S111]TGD12136.1 DivIVA domain-containing protein [Brevibacterium sp. S111]
MPLWIVIGVAAAIFVLVIVIAASFNVFAAETGDEAQERWTGLPEGFTSADLDTVGFRPALRGYRMEDVDEAMQILQDRLRVLESATDVSAQTPVDSAAADPAGPETPAPSTSPVPVDTANEAPETAAEPR